METFKSYLLVFLISTSLFLSYQLAYSKPNIDPIIEPEYIETELIGEQLDLIDMIHPQHILLHTKEQRYTILQPDTSFYNMIYSKLKQRTFDGLREVNSADINWGQMKKEVDGIEINFGDGVPLTMLKSVIQIQGDMFFNSDYINRIWMMITDNREEIRTFLFSASGLIVYESTRVDLTVRDIEQFIRFGELLTSYQLMNDRFYVPNTPLDLIEYRLEYNKYVPEQLKKSLFVDPSISHKLLDREGTEIITDGRRGITIYSEEEWISYSDSVTSVEFGNDVRENLLSAVQFVNRHGGWSGNYMVSHIPANRNQSFVFRQYFDSLPIISPVDQKFGYIKLVLQRGTVSSYERSLIHYDHQQEISRRLVSLPGGEELQSMLMNHEQVDRINSLQPVYLPIIKEDYLKLSPRWMIELTDGTYEFLPEI